MFFQKGKIPGNIWIRQSLTISFIHRITAGMNVILADHPDCSKQLTGQKQLREFLLLLTVIM